MHQRVTIEAVQKGSRLLGSEVKHLAHGPVPKWGAHAYTVLRFGPEHLKELIGANVEVVPRTTASDDVLSIGGVVDAVF